MEEMRQKVKEEEEQKKVAEAENWTEQDCLDKLRADAKNIAACYKLLLIY